MNKKILFTVISLLFITLGSRAQINGQTSDPSQEPMLIAEQSTQNVIRYGKISYNQIMMQMPEYKAAKEHMAQLRRKYEAEANYNESSFKRMFAEFLQGQKDFPQNIMLKRQRDLQDAMEKGIAFRKAADSLLMEAELELQKPLRTRLDSAIYLVGAEKGYECIFNIDTNSVPFLHPMITEDATKYVLEKLNALKH